ncbi:hypothetical protein PT974_09849 [Cladobotryum mycophilum]|uniref:Uncharacterized protein n=1 Tax=Cladobotryum mycophilum TaxID=491253 RepID=A0ABR0SHS5_9HYPO
MSRVELTWHLKLWQETGRRPELLLGAFEHMYPANPRLHHSYRATPKNVPECQILLPIPNGDLLRPGFSVFSSRAFLWTKALLKVLDGPICNMQKLKQCRVALPTSCFLVWKFRTPSYLADFEDELDLSVV